MSFFATPTVDATSRVLSYHHHHISDLHSHFGPDFSFRKQMIMLAPNYRQQVLTLNFLPYLYSKSS